MTTREELAERIDAIEPDARPRPLPLHRAKNCHLVHPGRTHRIWWLAVKDDREQQMRDHAPLWDQLGVVDPGAAAASREPSS